MFPVKLALLFILSILRIAPLTSGELIREVQQKGTGVYEIEVNPGMLLGQASDIRDVDPELAARMIEKASEMAVSAKEKLMVVESWFEFGAWLHRKNYFQLSGLAFENGISLSDELEMDHQHYDSIYIRLANIFWETGYFISAMDYTLRADILLKNRGDEKQRVITRNLMGVINRSLGNHQEAFIHFRQAAEMAERTEYKDMIGVVYANTGDLLRRMGDYDGALEYLKRGIEKEKEMEYKIPYLRSLTSIAHILVETERMEQAANKLEYAIALQDSIVDLIGLSRSLNLYAILKEYQGSYGASEKLFNRALAVAESIGGLTEQLESHEGLSRIYKTMGSFEKAYEHQSHAMKLYRDVYDAESHTKIRLLEDKLRLRDKENMIKNLEVRRQKAGKWAVSGLAIMLLLLVFTFFHLFKSRSRSVRQLEKMNREIGDQKHKLTLVNKDLETARKKAEESDRLKSAFLANISHEIRTPMNGIIGFSQLLQKNDLTLEDRDAYIEIIQNNGTDLLRILDDIIDIASIEAGHIKTEKSEFDPSDLLNELYLHFNQCLARGRKAKDINLLLNLHESVHGQLMVSDKLRLRQILVHLLDNAIKFTERGEVILGASFKQEAGGNNLRFFVRDTGIGISPDKVELVFKRFNQVECFSTRKYQGAGLGLSIAKGLVELLGGKINVESVPGLGSEFSFIIPIGKAGTLFADKPVIRSDRESVPVIFP